MGMTTRLLPTTQTTPLTCSATCSIATSRRTTTGAHLTTRTQWAACLSSRTCSTPCASRGPLAEQKHQMEAKIGNMTCVMRELNVLDASNNIDEQAMKRDTQKYTMPSEWFKNKYEHLLDTCY